MRRCLLLAILLLRVALHSCQSSYEDQEPRVSSYEDSLAAQSHPQDFLKRYNDIDYNSFVGLMGRRSSDDIEDAFTELLAQRNSQSSDQPFWKKDYPEPRRSKFLKSKRRLRRGL
ncbi:hypothetical protein GN956_G5998 [Arapaima gigas]